MVDTEAFAKTDREILLLMHNDVRDIKVRLDSCPLCQGTLSALWRNLRWTQTVVGLGAVVGIANALGFDALLKIAQAARLVP